MKLTVDMPGVGSCSATTCAYNTNKRCHARAITVGDAVNPACDTFFAAGTHHTHDKVRIAGVGACKVRECRFNDDFECTAEKISVEMSGSHVRCQTFVKRS